jgi:pimeloyl-ACP methyl ester carboxylesterase
MKRLVIGMSAIAALALVAMGLAVTQLPAIGAGALLFPSRHVNPRQRPAACVDRKFAAVGITLDGWQCRSASTPSLGTVVYLHGVADNRGSAVGAIERLTARGWDVVAYDSRAHGTSEGKLCTYGYFEKRDLQRVLDELRVDQVIVIGHSLGAAVALQAAAVEPRIRAVVAASTFSDLRTIASERAFGFPTWSLGPAFARAERDGNFVVDDVSPVQAAGTISVPVLLIHGAQDRDTSPIHSQRVFDALRGPKQLITVPNAGHNDVLDAGVWTQIEGWLDSFARNSGQKT